MLRIDGNEVVLNKNKGFIGAFEYNNVFKSSLTNDLARLINDGNPENMIYDFVVFSKLVYILSGLNKKYTFNDFINKIPFDYNFLDDFAEVITLASEIYFPNKKSKEITEKSED